MSKHSFPEDPAKADPHRAEGESGTPTGDVPPPDDGGAGSRKMLGVRRPATAPDGEVHAREAKPRRLGVRSRFQPNALKPERKIGEPRSGDRRSSRSVPAAAPEAAPTAKLEAKPAARPSSKPAARTAVALVAKPMEKPAAAPVPPPEGVRLSKVMAERGLCSRREADEIIERGWVFVDGQRVSELGIRIDPQAQIVLAPEATRRQAAQVTILLHKPVGYVSGQPEPGYEPAVSLIGGDNQFDRASAQRFHSSHLRGLAPAGRLDIDSTGLLVLTQNGRIARQLIGEDSKVDKEYIVRVQGDLAERDLERLNHGLELDGRKLRPALVEWINEDQLRFVLREGRKRQIRRMCELVGLKVVGLKRTRIGKVKLADLPLGEWRFLRDDERF